jgi:hypothetical protein
MLGASAETISASRRAEALEAEGIDVSRVRVVPGAATGVA